jgi:hypothetical protein
VLLRRLRRADKVRAAYERALELGPNEPERRVPLKTDAAVREVVLLTQLRPCSTGDPIVTREGLRSSGGAA